MHRRATVASLVAIPLLAVIACNDDQPQPKGTTTTTEQTEARSPEGTVNGPVAGLTQGPDDTQLAQRVALFEQAEFQASYAFSMNTQEGSSAGTLTGTLTWYQKSGKVRGDFRGTVGAEDVDVMVIPGPGYPSEEFLYVCQPQEQTCTTFQPEDEQQGYPGIGLIVLGSVLLDGREFSEALSVTGTSERTVAGEEVLCFQGAGVAGASIETGEACATEDGIVLALTQDSGGQIVSLTATDVSRDVGDDVFALPFPLVPG